ncbi:AAA family ATPase [Cellulosilyticum sp. ST5]|uniref:AAA family ATPase n=1 Tax=Cellulosilyticum sp. ST5 TaxID=3055805 RepID=UPI003977B648
MAKAICIIGESGAGKTTSLRHLNPNETYFIDADKKGSAWRGFRQQYNAENKNYIATDDPNKILTLMKGISEKTQLKYIIIDTLNGVMVGEEIRRSKEKGFDKWADLVVYIYSILDIVSELREDLTIIYTAHSETERTEDGYMWTRMKTTGKKLNKLVPESKFNVVLLAKCKDGRYIFETHSNNSTAKTPLDAFEEDEIENDIVPVLKVLEDY